MANRIRWNLWVIGAIGLCLGWSNGCSGNSDLSTAGSGGTSGTGPTGTGASTPRGDGLIGTWDFIASADAETSSGVIEIATNRFSITRNDEERFQYWDESGTTAALYQYRYSSGSWDNTALSVARTPAAFDPGALALSVGGTSRFSDGSQSMQLDLAGGQVMVRFFDERGQLAEQYTAMRQQTATSSFGELGGTWLVYELGDTNRSCTFTFGVNTFVADCARVPALAGGVSMTFNGNAASGLVTPSGEVSAFRR